MIRRILGSFLLLYFSFLEAGSISATIDSQEIFEGDTVILTLAVIGKNIDYIPEIDEIAGQKILTVQRRSEPNYISVNGVTIMEERQTLMLEFRPEHNLTIPSFSVKVDGKLETTKPIKITVKKSSTGSKRESSNFSLDVQIGKNSFYLGESVLLTVYFKQRTSVDVMNIEYQPPAFKDFFSKQIGKDKTYKKGAYTIQELNYLLIAKKAGKLTLEPATAKVAKRTRQRQMGGWYMDVPKWIKISSLSLIVNVKAPTDAHDIVGDYRLTQKIEHTKVKANKPLHLTIELLGEGTLDDYEGVDFKIPNVTVYADNAKVKSTLIGRKLNSHYSKSFVFIANHDFTIPSKTIRAYNYKTGEIKLLKTKAYSIEVDGGKLVTDSSMVYTKNSVNLSTNKGVVSGQSRFPSLLALFLAFVLGIVITYFFKYLSHLFHWKPKGKSFRGDEAWKILYPKMSESKEVEEMVRKLYAIRNGNKKVEIDKQQLKTLVEKYRDKQ